MATAINSIRHYGHDHCETDIYIYIYKFRALFFFLGMKFLGLYTGKGLWGEDPRGPIKRSLIWYEMISNYHLSELNPRQVMVPYNWPPQACEWQKEMTLGISLSGTHLLIIWSGQYLNKYGSSQKNCLTSAKNKSLSCFVQWLGMLPIAR